MLVNDVQMSTPSGSMLSYYPTVVDRSPVRLGSCREFVDSIDAVSEGLGSLTRPDRNSEPKERVRLSPPARPSNHPEPDGGGGINWTDLPTLVCNASEDSVADSSADPQRKPCDRGPARVDSIWSREDQPDQLDHLSVAIG